MSEIIKKIKKMQPLLFIFLYGILILIITLIVTSTIHNYFMKQEINTKGYTFLRTNILTKKDPEVMKMVDSFLTDNKITRMELRSICDLSYKNISIKEKRDFLRSAMGE